MVVFKDKKRVMYVARFIPFYREGILRRLTELYDCRFICQDKQFGTGHSPDLPEIVRLPMKTYFGRLDWLPIRKQVKTFDPEVVISELGLSFVTVFCLLLGKFFHGYKLMFWTHGLEGPRKEGRMWVSDYIRKWILRFSDGVVYYTEGCAKVTQPYLGKLPYYVAPNTLDTDSLDLAWSKLEVDPVSFKPQVVFIGRMVEAKRVRELLNLAQQLKDKKSSVRLIMIGDGPLRALLEKESQERKLPIDWLGDISDPDEKASLLACSLAGVCLGRVGLNIVDCLAFGLPLLTLKRQDLTSTHGPEIDYLIDGETGWLCESPESVTMHIEDLNENEKHRLGLRESCRSYFESYCSIENQVKGIIDAVENITHG